ncbi:rhamnogalacturonan acetylesterase [Flavilitoribacter nigricans]|uniref:Rhamnogalacturonan acetylesterase n=1 Tax=Flavilitoribacter nigricans (strain ATCC 23147 / DSM 23189 / NBRC 102662 / NCIMB 1420 / SS-2) TaxID=1122177 RepID=A0A2D0MZE1_FLAN2|nr:rhamnogalacturonan acetylesterase [Flavilitoribacter nigricans]PHN01641.1 rhamnogalacturonan acetylesterase [Flavilitoribacter nigricans DSM 23189 = NBRC 102662]
MKIQSKISLLLTGLVLAAMVLAAMAFSTKPPTVYLIGDSTMANKEGTIEENPERGWGQALQQYFQPTVSVQNHAVNGRSSKSFIDEGRWDKVLESLQAGDYVMIQFGHNDQKYKDPKRYTNPTTTYYHNLSRFVRETREKGATPILLTSIVRRNFNEFGTLEDTHGIYPLIVRQVAGDLDVFFIDHLYATETIVRERGEEPSKDIYLWFEPGEHDRWPDGRQDNTHLSPEGADLYARIVANAILDSRLPLREYIKD